MEKLRLYSKIGNVLQRKKTFFRILLAMGCCTLTVVLLMSAGMYNAVRNIITEQSIAMSVQTFNQIQTIVDGMSQTANSLATQILLEDSCSQLLLASHEEDLNPVGTYAGVRQLVLYKNINENIDSIYIYNRNADTIFTSEGKAVYRGIDSFYDAGLLEIIDNFDDYKDRVLIKRRIYKHDGNAFVGDRDVYTYIIGNMYSKGELINAVVINISADWLVNTLLGSQNLERSIMEVIDEAEQYPLVDMSNIEGVDSGAFEDTVLTMAKEGRTYCEYAYNGEKYFISYLYSPKMGWSFVKISEWNVIFGALNKLQSGVILLVWIIVAVCLVVSLFGAGTIYRLFSIAEVKYNKLVGIRRSNGAKLRDSFLSDLVMGAKDFDAGRTAAKLDELEVRLDIQALHSLAVLKIENYAELSERYDQSAMYGIKYGLRNIFEEISQPYFGVVGILGKENEIILILTPKEGLPLDRSLVESTFEQFCSKATIFINGSYNLIGTSEQARIEGLPVLWRKLSPILGETFFYPANSYLDCDTVLNEHSNSLDAGLLEHRILQSLLAGDREEALRQYQHFSDAIAGCSSDDYINTLTWLGFSIVRAVSAIESGGRLDRRSYFNDFLVGLMACQKHQAVDELFGEMLTRALDTIEQANIKTGASGKIEEIQRYIAQHYADENLSQEALASEFDISSSYLGKLFRKANSLSVAEYINQVRLQHVVELMASDNQSIKDIAHDCGFPGANYFYTYFKKKYGVTPQVYREKLKQQE